MEKYIYDAKKGRIFFQKEKSDLADEEENSIYLMSFDEFAGHPRKLPRKNAFIHSMTPIQYCKIEKYKECIQGTMRVPKGNKGQLTIHNFGFYLSGSELYFVEESHFLMEHFNKMLEGDYNNYSLRQILLALLEQLLTEDVLYLQKQEEHLAELEEELLKRVVRTVAPLERNDFGRQFLELEEELLKRVPDYFYEMIMKYRKRLNIFHSYYEQLINMCDVMQTSVNIQLVEEEKAEWQLFSNRAERLHDHVEMLREYLVQIRELYQSLIAVKQNQVMSILTVVTTIFLPLTLIVGWYGMNFPNMPEFGWKYAYLAVIIVSITVVVIEVVYFKKKKML